MQTTLIGRAFARSRVRRWSALAIMSVAIGVDLALTSGVWIGLPRYLLTAIAVLLMWLVSGRSSESLGLRLSPIQPVRQWIVMTVRIGLGMLAIFAVLITCGYLLGIKGEVPRVAPTLASVPVCVC